MPIEALEDNETFTVPDAMIGRGGNHYVLRVRGNSMVDEQIRDGDFVVVNERQSADNGEMVVANVNGEVTLKRMYREGERVRLQPANSCLQPIYVHRKELDIQGRLLAVLRKYK